MNKSSIFKAVLGGFAIGLGSTGYLVIGNGYLGAFLFALGLSSILTFRWNLFTGMICSHRKMKDYIVCYLGNAVGAVMCAVFYYLTYGFFLGKSIAKTVLEPKYDKGLIRVIFAGIMCEVCIFIAVTGFKNAESALGKYLLTVMAVMLFVLCGFEHSIANLFYTIVYAPSLWKFLYFNIGSLIGNIIGAIGIRSLVRRSVTRRV